MEDRWRLDADLLMVKRDILYRILNDLGDIGYYELGALVDEAIQKLTFEITDLYSKNYKRGEE